MVAPNSEIVEYTLLLHAEQVVRSLQQATAQATSFSEKISMVQAKINSFSKQTGMSVKSVTSTFREFDELLSHSGEGSVLFGQLQKQAWQQLGNSAESGTQRALKGVNALRIALGAVISMLLFSAIQAISTFFSTAITQAREYEDTLYRLVNVERDLSEKGIDISMKGLEEGINKIKKLQPIFSKEDIAQTVGLLAISTKQLGFTEQQILDLTTAVGILNVRSLDNESISTTAQHLLSALLTDNAKGVTALGVSFGETNLQAKGMELGFLAAGEAASNLTANEKGVTKLAIILESANGELGAFGDYLNTNTARMKVLQAAWSDFLLLIGQKMTPVVAKLSETFTSLIESVTRWIEENETSFNTMVTFLAGALNLVLMLVGGFVKLSLIVGVVGAKFYDFLSKLPLIGDAIKILFPDVKFGDTPTNPLADGGMGADAQKYGEKYAEAITKAEDEIADLMKEARDKRLNIERDYQRKLEDIARNHSQKLQDIARNTAQKTEDANRNYGQKIEDINRDANQKIAEAQEDSHKKELDAEAEFQRKLAELRQKFLFDLEDALHERDARQVLRLIRQYNFDKKNLEDKRKQEQEESKLSLQNKLEDIEIERQQKLDAAKREQEEKLAEIALYAQRERADAAIANRRALADARLDHQRKLQENREYLKRKLQDIADAITKEFQLTAAGAQAISSLLGSYFGAGGAVANIFGGLQSQLGGMTQVGGSGAVSGNGSFQDFGSTFNTLTGGKGYGFAEGGTLIATRPTKAIFGEKGPEQVSFAPLGRVGRNVNQVFGGSGAGANGGSITLEVALSPDLEARIIDSSLENIALTLEKISRSK